MCGIAGIYSRGKSINVSDQTACLRMLEAIKNRGPDARGLHQDKHMVLGHQRLTVIDPSDAANQPLSNEDGTLWLSCNGEIYNFRELRKSLISKGHRFKSQTDSEVILHLYEMYGTECLEHLQGMFAFALWDERRRHLFLARDRIGIKPLYYGEADGNLLFASEVRAILASRLIPPEQHPEALIQFLQCGSVPSPLTTFRNIQSLPAGHYLMVDDRGISMRQYWDLGKILLNQDARPVDLTRLRHEMIQTTQAHLMSDVPLGILLSGGMDSSSLVALARYQNNQELRTLTVGFEESRYDESRFAKLVSRNFSTRHHQYLLGATEVADHIDDFFEAMDQPSVDGLNTYIVAKAAKKVGLRVLLSGLGGDEVFGGYPHFKNVSWLFRSLPWLKQMPHGMRCWLTRCLVELAKQKKLYGADRLQYLEHPSLENAYRVYRGLFPPNTIRRLFNDESLVFNRSSTDSDTRRLTHVDKAIYLEFDHYLHDQLLRDCDIMSMHHSIEVRVPFLDHRIVEMILSLSTSKRFHPRIQKTLLQKVMKGSLPQEIFNRPKQGFTFPFADWMRGPLKSRIEDVLLETETLQPALSLNRRAVSEVWGGFLRDTIHWSQPWALFILKSWQRSLLERAQCKVSASLDRQHVSHSV